MAVQSVTLNLPDALYRRWEKRAKARQRSIEAELLEVVTQAGTEEQLLAEHEEALGQLVLLEDEALQRVATGQLPAEISAQLEALHLKQQREGLLPEERARTDALMRQYERHLLLRAEAIAQLQKRGQVIPSPTEFNARA